jgi:glycosyltransferase involved in cell wall biosynthesis
VFHDLVLHHIIADLYTGKHADWDGYRGILTEEVGDAAPTLFRLRRHAMWSATEHFLIPLNRHVATRARAIVVHSEEAREKLGDVAPAIPISVIPHHAGTPPPEVGGLSRDAARAELGLPVHAFIAGQFGFVTIPKQPGPVLRGFARLLQRNPDALLLLVGQNQTPGRSLDRLIRSVGVAEHVRVIGFVDLPTFYRYLKAVDVVINLRYPSAGEASGTFARALAEGRAVMASNLGSFAEVPAGVAMKVEVDGDQAEELGRHLVRLAGDPRFKASLEERARQYAATFLDQGRCADLYLEVARSLASTTVTSLR